MEGITPDVQTIELDCPPGSVRPGDLIGKVIEGTGLPERAARDMCFGNWTFDYNDIDPEIWKNAKPILEQRITELYNKKIIRYGSW